MGFIFSQWQLRDTFAWREKKHGDDISAAATGVVHEKAAARGKLKASNRCTAYPVNQTCSAKSAESETALQPFNVKKAKITKTERP